MRLIKSAEQAAEWGISDAELKRRIRRYGWPCVRLSRTDVRFTEQQVEQIVAMATTAGKKPTTRTSTRTGQSRRSASRAS